MLLIIIWYFFVIILASALASTSRNWPRPRRCGLSLEVLASFNITANMTDRRGNVYEPVEILQQSTSSST